MIETGGLAIGTLPDFFGKKRENKNAQKINNGIEMACLEIVDRIDRTKETATDKELIDLSLCLSGLITAWNLASMRADYRYCTSPMTACYDGEGSDTR